MQERLRKIDEVTGHGRALLAAPEIDAADARVFYSVITSLIDDIYGSDSRFAADFAARDPSASGAVAEGLQVLENLRKLAVYSGEYSS